jgi:hypothetical protein
LAIGVLPKKQQIADRKAVPIGVRSAMRFSREKPRIANATRANWSAICGFFFERGDEKVVEGSTCNFEGACKFLRQLFFPLKLQETGACKIVKSSFSKTVFRVLLFIVRTYGVRTNFADRKRESHLRNTDPYSADRSRVCDLRFRFSSPQSPIADQLARGFVVLRAFVQKNDAHTRNADPQSPTNWKGLSRVRSRNIVSIVVSPRGDAAAAYSEIPNQNYQTENTLPQITRIMQQRKGWRKCI